MLPLQRLMSLQHDQQRRHWQTRVQNESIVSVDERKALPCQTNDDADSHHAAKRTRCSNPDLPEDIWFSIHSLMPMREAARAACLSHAFLRSWRCHTILIFNVDTFGLNGRNFSQKVDCMSGRNFSRKVDRILSKHIGIGVKIFKLEYLDIWEFDASHYLESWLQVAVKPGIEELTLVLCKTMRKYNFPCPLLSDGVGSSLRHLKLRSCALHPTSELGPLRNLTTLQLLSVSVTGDELEGLFYNSLALEHLDLSSCRGIICLKIPCALQQLSSLEVLDCWRLKMIESKAPNLSSFHFRGFRVKLLLGETLQMKKLEMQRDNFVCYARTELPCHMPNLATLVIHSRHEVVNTPMLPTKFIYLKHLTIDLMSGSPYFPSYDYFSLVSFFDVSPSLETFTIINVKIIQAVTDHESIFSNPSDLRQMPEHRHGHLKNVKISGFSSEKSLVELTCYILKNAVPLECITLDTVYGHRGCHPKTRCMYIPDRILVEAPRALSAIRTYIEDKVPPSVKLTVLEPCSQCHIPRVLLP